MFEVLEHTADAGIGAFASTLEDAFAETARGMFSLIGSTRDTEPTIVRVAEVEGGDLESLLHGFLSELLYLYDGEGVFYLGAELTITDGALKAVVQGCPAESAELETEIKAVTFHRMSVAREDDGWKTTVFFDI